MKKTILIVLFFFIFFSLPIPVFAVSGDLNGDNKVDIFDLRQIINGFLNIFSYNTTIKNYSLKVQTTPTPNPTTPPVSSYDWVQDAHDAQRTGSTTEDPGNGSKWTFAWFWTSPSNNSPPKEGRAITGGGNIYIPTGSNGLYALSLSSGSQVWRSTTTTFNASAAYDNGFVYVGGANNYVYKINATNGSVSGSYNAASPINKAVMIVGNFVYAVSDDGSLHKINMSDMTLVWKYSAGTAIATPPAYSASKDLIIYGTNDLYIHAVNNSDGSRKWKVKPSPNSAGSSNSSGWNSLYWGWPVIADQHGIVLIRQQLPHQAHFDGPNSGKFANTNAENRTWLTQNPQDKNLFALDLDTGTEKFIPAVGYGSTELNVSGTSVGVMGTIPIVKTWANGNEVAYVPFRNGQSPCSGSDYRSSGHMGEMVLDDNLTVSGLSAGDLRFVKMNRDCNQGGQSYTHIIDEETPITFAGNTLFHAHWGASDGVVITDRTASKGLTYSSPISTTNLPTVIRAQNGCGSNHIANCGLTLYNDGRFWDGPGYYEYLNQTDPPGPNASGSYSAGFLPRYTFVSNGYVIVEGNGGDLFVLKHN